MTSELTAFLNRSAALHAMTIRNVQQLTFSNLVLSEMECSNSEGEHKRMSVVLKQSPLLSNHRSCKHGDCKKSDKAESFPKFASLTGMETS